MPAGPPESASAAAGATFTNPAAPQTAPTVMVQFITARHRRDRFTDGLPSPVNGAPLGAGGLRMGH